METPQLRGRAYLRGGGQFIRCHCRVPLAEHGLEAFPILTPKSKRSRARRGELDRAGATPAPRARCATAAL
jgi:hypothetical protein